MAAAKTIDYQKLSAELEQVIARLQDDQTSIEESLKLYERGVNIASDLEQYLKTTENRLSKLSPKSEA